MNVRKNAATFSWIHGSWWTFVCCFLIIMTYIQALKSRNAAISEISFRFHEMEKEKRYALEEKEDLELRLASQNDPAWIEMVLMREIGVVPEGWRKVHFKGS